MKFTRKKSFLDDTRYLFHMGRVSGNVFFSLQDSWFGTEMCLYTLHVLLEVAITWVHYAACLNVVIWEYRNVVTKAEEIFYILLSFFLITSKPIYYFFKRKTFQEIFARIDLDQHHDHPKRGRSAAKHLCLLVSNIIVHIIVCYFVGVPTKSYIAYNVVFAAEILIAFCEYSLMYFMVQHAKGQLRAINNVIGKLLTGGAVSTAHKSAGTLYSVVSALMDVHADARALISDFYSLFLPSIMTVVVLDVIMMTICIDYIVKSFMFGSYSNLDDAIMVSWSLYLFFMGGVQLVLGIVMWVDLPNEVILNSHKRLKLNSKNSFPKQDHTSHIAIYKLCVHI